jgi:hypothetical protein
MNCPNCGTETKDFKFCPECGIPIRKILHGQAHPPIPQPIPPQWQPTAKKEKKPFVIVALALLVVLISVSIVNSMVSEIKKELEINDPISLIEESDYDFDELEDIFEDEPVSAPSNSGFDSKLATKSDWYDSGSYKVGEEIPAGLYYFESVGESSYYDVSLDSSGSIESGVAGSYADTFSFISIEEGQYFEIYRGKVTLAEHIETIEPKNGKYGDGMYRVGIDIPAGEYNLLSASSDPSYSAYYSITSNASGDFESLIDNKMFERNSYVTVSDGQYLLLYYAYILVD